MPWNEHSRKRWLGYPRQEVVHLSGRSAGNPAPSRGFRSQVRDSPSRSLTLFPGLPFSARGGHRRLRAPSPAPRGAFPSPARRGPDRLGKEAERTLSPTWQAGGPAPAAPGAGLRVQGSAGAATPVRQGTAPGSAAVPDLASGAWVPSGLTAHARRPRRGAGRERPGQGAGVGAAPPARQCACAAAWELQRPESSAPHLVLIYEGVGCIYREFGWPGNSIKLNKFLYWEATTVCQALPKTLASLGGMKQCLPQNISLWPRKEPLENPRRPQVRGHAFAGLVFKFLTENTGNAFSIVFGSLDRSFSLGLSK